MSKNKIENKTEDPFIVIVSNRGPIVFSETNDGEFEFTRGAGGLVTALGTLAKKHEVAWVAMAINEDDKKWTRKNNQQLTKIDDIYLKLLDVDEDAYSKYYNQIANPLIWFIQHQIWNVISDPIIDKQTWDAWETGYKKVNQELADAVYEIVKDVKRKVIVLVQDYHLYLTPKFLRDKLGDDVSIQPFVHIPWPGPDAWRMLPEKMRKELLEGLIASDIIGFQTKKDAFNFVQTCRFYLEDAHSFGARDAITYKGKKIYAKSYPISVDIEQMKNLENEAETKFFLTEFLNLIHDRKVILRVDRVEPSKNILRGIDAFEALLQEHPEHIGHVQMLALLVPSRMEVEEYQDYLQQIMAKAGMINAEYSNSLWEPIRIILGDNYKRAIAAMQLYDVLIVNPVADGMNLVAKEGVLVNKKNGVLVLSENAGAYYEMGNDAISISPFDVYGTATALHEALEMSSEERFRRASNLQAIVRGSDVNTWFENQVEDSLASINNEDKN